MTIEIKEKLTGSILDIGGGGEAVIGQIYNCLLYTSYSERS